MKSTFRQLLITAVIAALDEDDSNDTAVLDVVKGAAASVGKAKLQEAIAKLDEMAGTEPSEDAKAAEAANKLAGGTKANSGKAPAKKPATKKPKITKAMVTEVAEKVAAEDTDELKDIFADAGVKNLTSMPTSKYAEVYNACAMYLENLLGEGSNDSDDSDDSDDDDNPLG